MTTKDREYTPPLAWSVPTPPAEEEAAPPVQVRMVPAPEKIEVPCAHTPEEIHDFLGRMPVRTELTVLPADDVKGLTLGWKVFELDGTEVCRDAEQTQTITRREDLKPGDVVYVQTLFHLCKATVHQEPDGKLFATSGETIIFLDFRDDPKIDPRAPCWVSPGAANARALRKLEAK